MFMMGSVRITGALSLEIGYREFFRSYRKGTLSGFGKIIQEMQVI
jgi:hypothetical protein